MFFKNRKSYVLNFALILALLGWTIAVSSVRLAHATRNIRIASGKYPQNSNKLF